MTHDELAHNLATHLIADDRMVWEDLPAGKAGSIRPDVYTIRKSYSNPSPISYEIKVSVSDFRSDVTSGKWKGYLEFSDGVVFAVPKGLITRKDLPLGCGLITFNGQFWNTVKRPTLHNSELNSELLLKLLISGKERQSQPDTPKLRGFHEEMHLEKLRQKFGYDFRRKIAELENHPQMVAELEGIRKCLADAIGIELCDWGFERRASRRIEEITLLADEKGRKEKLNSELDRLKKILCTDIDRFSERI